MWLAQGSDNELGTVIGLIAVSGFFGTIMLGIFIGTVCSTYRKVRIAKTNANLVMNMVDRGFTPAEIRDIVIVSSGDKNFNLPANTKPPRQVNVPPQKPIVQQHA